jgi:hypothetical protein
LRTEWAAFAELQYDRPVGMAGAGAIPWSAIDRWAQRNGITDPDEFAALVACLRALDRVWLAEQAKQSQADDEPKER